MPYSIGTDIGGTFTDCVVVDDEGALVTGKAPSTPPNFTMGFFAAITDAASHLGLAPDELLTRSQTLVHATTAGSNAVVQRTGARVGLLATKGHGEAMLIMRGGGRTKGLDVDDLLDIPATDKPEPIVPRELIIEVTERVDAAGEVVVPLDEDEVRQGIEALIERGAEAIAISFLWSFLHPAHELRARQIAWEIADSTFVTCSHEIAPQLGEYYRTVATVMNAYLGPLMLGYTYRIVEEAEQHRYGHPVLFAQCVGGAGTVQVVQKSPLLTLDSGPVSGVVAAAFLGQQFGYENIITADMGGTTFDVSVIASGAPQRRDMTVINQYEMYLPMLGVESIGAGGGSIAWIDPASGTMKVGPRSAGAEPGPVCYGLGGDEPTVTDANLVLGFLNPETFLGGRRRLSHDAARAAIARLGDQLGLTVEQTASGIIEIVDHTMAEKIRRMTVARGYDPRDFSLFAFGGAAPAHAASLAAELGVRRVLVPLGDIASVLSAMGTVSSDVAHVYERSVRHPEPFDMDAIEPVFTELEDQARRQLESEGFSEERIELRRFVSMKYAAQVYDLEIPFRDEDGPESLVQRFEREYATQFGRDSGYRAAGIEVVRQRVYASGRLPRPRVKQHPSLSAGDRGSPPPMGRRDVWWRETGGYQPTPIFDESVLNHTGWAVEGPAVIDLPDTTVVIRPGDMLEVDAYGNLVLLVGG